MRNGRIEHPIRSRAVTAPRRLSISRRWLVSLALAALLATQWLALLHTASGHGFAHGGAVAAAELPAAAPADSADTDHAPLGLEWAHDDGSAFCKLLDHCVLAKHVACAAPAPAVAQPDRLVCAARPVAAPGAAPARYLARAPPLRVPTHTG